MSEAFSSTQRLDHKTPFMIWCDVSTSVAIYGISSIQVISNNVQLTLQDSNLNLKCPIEVVSTAQYNKSTVIRGLLSDMDFSYWIVVLGHYMIRHCQFPQLWWFKSFNYKKSQMLFGNVFKRTS